MALKATIHKAAVNIADMDRNFFQDVNLTIAQHPSETDQRMMLRLLAWICHADERLQFTKGLSADDEPEIWRHNDHNGIELWVELGLPRKNGCVKPVTNHSKLCSMSIVKGPLKCGGHKLRKNYLGTVTFGYASSMMSKWQNWRRCLIAICHCRPRCKRELFGYLMIRIIWKLVLMNGKAMGNKRVDHIQ